MSVQGICELCRNSGDLVKSHLELPKFVYKRLRSDAAMNPHPVQIGANGLEQTQAQQRLPGRAALSAPPARLV